METNQGLCGQITNPYPFLLAQLARLLETVRMWLRQPLKHLIGLEDSAKQTLMKLRKETPKEQTYEEKADRLALIHLSPSFFWDGLSLFEIIHLDMKGLKT